LDQKAILCITLYIVIVKYGSTKERTKFYFYQCGHDQWEARIQNIEMNVNLGITVFFNKKYSLY